MHIHIGDAAAPIRVLLLYPDPLFQAGLHTTIASHQRFALTVASDEQEALRAIDRQSVDVVVTDYESALRLGRGDRGGPDRGRNAMQSAPKLMVVTWRRGADEIRAALLHGVQGYVLMWCAVPDLLSGIEALHAGRRHLGEQVAKRLAQASTHDALTDRENDVLQLVAQGLSNKSVARELDIAVATVKAHVKSIFAKLGAGSRTQASVLARRLGLVVLDPHDEPPGMRPADRSSLSGSLARDYRT